MVEEDLGEATIVYENRDGEAEEMNVQNEHVAYFQDHWIVRTGEDDQGRDRVRRIPHGRVYHVERTVEQFEEEVKTLRDQVQSMAEELRSRLPVPGGESRGRGREREPADRSRVTHIDVEEGEEEHGGGSGGSSHGASGGGEDWDEDEGESQ
jgi:hypothetical protein